VIGHYRAAARGVALAAGQRGRDGVADDLVGDKFGTGV
jgi:hypothetical protein